MNILYVLHQFNLNSLRGVELQTLELARHFSKKDKTKVSIFTTEVIEDNLKRVTDAKEGNIYRKRHDNIDIFYLALKKSTFAIPEFQDNKNINIINDAFNDILKKTCPDIVHFHHLKNLSLDLPGIAQKNNIATAISIYDYWSICPNVQMLQYSGDKIKRICLSPEINRCSECINVDKKTLTEYYDKIVKTLNSSDIILTYSRYLTEIFLGLGIYKEKIRYIDASHFNPERFEETKKTASDSIRLASIGTLGRHKGPEVILKAFEKLNKNIPGHKLKLTFYGSLDSFSNVKEYYDKINMKIPANVYFKDETRFEDMHNIYSEIDYLIFASLWLEPSPRSVQEAYLSKTPIICSSTPSIHENIPKESIMTFPVGDTDALYIILKDIATKKLTTKDFSFSMQHAKDFTSSFDKIETLYNTQKEDIKASIIIPIKDPGNKLYSIIEMISKQDFPDRYELILIDSSSTSKHKGPLLRRCSELKIMIKYIKIHPDEFNHGLTRDRAAYSSSGEFLVFLTQDAIPADKRWLSSLIKNFSDKKVAGVFSRQLPRKETKDKIEIGYLKSTITGKNQKRTFHITDLKRYDLLQPDRKIEFSVFENPSSCIRKSIWSDYNFGDFSFGEDIYFAKRVTESGYKNIFEPKSTVLHSHNPNMPHIFKRSFLDRKVKYQLFKIRYEDYSFHNFYDYFKETTRYNTKRVNDSFTGISAYLKLKIMSLSFSETLGGYLGFIFARLQKREYDLFQKDTKNLTSMMTEKGNLPAIFLHPPNIQRFKIDGLNPSLIRFQYTIDKKADDRFNGAIFQVFSSSKKIFEDTITPKDRFYPKKAQLNVKSKDISFITLPITFYNFLENFSKKDINKIKDWPVDIAFFKIKNKKQEVIMQHPPSQIHFNDVFIPDNAVLTFSHGIDNDAIKNFTPTNFSIYLDDKCIYSSKDISWKAAEISLKDYSRKKVNIILETTPQLCYDFLKNFKKNLVKKNHDWPVGIAFFRIHSKKKKVIMQHPPSEIKYKDIYVTEHSILSFNIGFDDDVLKKQHGNVIFKIYADDEMIFTKSLNPSDNKLHRQWFNYSISLERFKDRKIDLTFITENENGNEYNSVGWLDLKLVYDDIRLEEMKDLDLSRFEPIGKNWTGWLDMKISSNSYPLWQVRYFKANKDNDYNWAYIIDPKIMKTYKQLTFAEKLKFKVLKRIDRWCIGGG